MEPLLPPEGGGLLELATGVPSLGFVEPLLRRRLSPLGRAMLHCAGRVAEGLGPLPSVFASRHGEVARSLPILEDLARGLPSSPTQFSMNVHNAVAGVWSIARQDPSPSISVAAGPETFGLGLLEALSLHDADPSQPVLFVYADEPLPAPFATFADREAPLHAVALLIGLPATRQLVLERKPGGAGDPAPVPQSLQALQTLHSGLPQGPWAEAGGTWRWTVE
ncbi:MAG: beta-ketoacyl synthase chain length factor [Geothrix sp.]|uniref:beta-ketoacyl synthase chain length factor n=1 Tax=Geothrix sp. TaxID=1962974 RepID=UPI0018477BD3|nr:beta-ketoacyl synthase chain length factor [Geothrix sp.]NWJ41181.1 beta-ketoacyl synthase chain length factor [Geothrix sp.]WIL20828.1 MAG: beta-ketoacyl synthase chain length factor [Geothrix sp.]